MASSPDKHSSVTAKTQEPQAKSPETTFFSKEGGSSLSRGSPPFFQPKLKVHPAGDSWEKEADRVADRVMQTPAPATGKVQRMKTDEDESAQAKGIADGFSHVQTQRAFESPSSLEQNSAGGGDEMGLQSKSAGGPDAAAASGASDAGGSGAGSGAGPDSAGGGLESQLRSSKGGGQPLPEETRSKMESGIGADFSGVRVHTGPDAAQMSQGIGARAFTHGNDIYFNDGEYRPATGAGDHLLAHELTHTVQQGASKTGGVQRKEGSSVGQGASTAGNQTSFGTTAPLPVPAEAPAERQPTEMQSIAAMGDGGIQRAGDDGGGDKPHDGKEGKVTRAGNTYQFEIKEISVPVFKVDGTKDSDLKIPDAERDNKQADKWDSEMMSRNEGKVNARVKELTDKTTPIGDKKDVYVFKYKGGNLIGTKPDIAKKVIRPFWDSAGNYHRFDVDHIHEFQLGGADTYENFWLLDSAINRKSGDAIKTEKYKRIQALIDEAASKSGFWPKGKPSAKEVRNGSRFTVTIKAKSKTNLPGFSALTPEQKYNKQDILDGKSTEHLEVLKDKDLKALGLSGDNSKELTIFRGPNGGMPRKFALDAEKNLTGNSIMIGNLEINPAKSRIKFEDNGAIKAGSTIAIEIFKNNQVINKKLKLKAKDFNVNIYPLAGLSHIGYLNSNEWSKLFKDAIEAAGLSPIDFQQIDLDDKDGMVIRGKILPSVPIIANANIDFVLRGNDFYLEKTFTAEEFKVPAPFKISGASLTIRAGTVGLEFEGNVSFGIDKVGEGTVSAYINSKKEFGVTGEFNFDKKLFDNAKVKVTYINEKWAVEGSIEIPPKKVKGIKKATATIAYSEGTLAAAGTVEPDIKGVKQGSFELKYSAEQFMISGKLELSNEIPRLKKGELNVTLESAAAGGYKLKGNGVAEFDFPGINTGLTVQYDDGLLTIEATVHFEKGMAKGDVKAGATNRPVDGAGNPQGEPGSKWTFYGSGSLTIKITPWLQATAGVQFLPNGELKVLGRIELPSTVDVFGQKSFEKNLFNMPTIEIPLFAIPLGPKSLGLVAQIRGGLDFKASIGPGQLKGLYGQIEYNPSKPEETTLSGGGAFVIPAEASLNLHASLGLGLSVGIASLTGGIEVVAGVGLKGEASAAIDLSWNPTSGLELNAEGKVTVQPKFKFDVNLFARASLDLLITDISKEWRYNLASFEYGPGFEFGLIFPVHYKEGQPFNISFDDIQVIKPDVDILGTAKGLASKVKDEVF